jgi:hypothetical protein
MCLSKEVGRIWVKDIMLAKKTTTEAAIFFKMHPKDVTQHMDEHEIVEDAEGNFNSPDFFMNELLKQLRYLHGWLAFTSSSGNMSREDIELSIKLSREIRATVESLETSFRGRNSSSTITVNIENLNQKYLAITNLLLTDGCDTCQKKVLDLMETIDVTPKLVE